MSARSALQKEPKIEPSSEIFTAAVLGFATRFCLSLCAPDARAIESQHGLTLEAQMRAGIRSVLSNIGKLVICHEISLKFGAHRQYPAPFYFDTGLRLNQPSSGFIVPCRYQGLQRAWLHYKHPKDDSPIWCSGACFGGAKARPSIHVSASENVKRTGVCVLVRDALRAEACATGGVVCFVGLNNVMPHALTAQLRAALPDLRAVLIDPELIEPSLTRALKFAGLRWEVT
jgi:hypothetical protein